MEHDKYRSYLVRFWGEDEGEEPGVTWHGEVESIQTGQKWEFASLETMCDFLQAQVLGEQAEESDQENS